MVLNIVYFFLFFFFSFSVYSLYDPCDLNEQCSVLDDPKSVCNSVCVCAPYARDRKGRCISLCKLPFIEFQFYRNYMYDNLK